MNGFTFFGSYYEALSQMTDEDRHQAMDALCQYVFDGEEPDALSPTVRMFMALVKPNVDASVKARKSGAKGGRAEASEAPLSSTLDKHPSEAPLPSTLPKHPSEAPLPSTLTKREDKDMDMDIGEGIEVGEGEVQGEETKRKRFTPPTPEEVRDYCTQNGYSVDPDRFVDFYTSKGWKVGNQPMKDWKAAVRNWSKKEPVARSGTYMPKSNRTQQDWMDLERSLVLSQRGTG